MYYSYNFISSVYCYCSGFMNSQHDPSRRNLVLYHIHPPTLHHIQLQQIYSSVKKRKTLNYGV